MKNKTKQFKSYEYIKVDPHVFSKVKFDDFVGNSDEGFLKLNKNKKELLVKAPITHSGRLTANRGWYQPRKMKEGKDSLVTPYNKPLLLNHDTKKDPMDLP